MLFIYFSSERAGKDKRVERAAGVCKKAVAAFTFSWKKKRDLAVAQEELHLPQHKLVTESPTRSGSKQEQWQRCWKKTRDHPLQPGQRDREELPQYDPPKRNKENHGAVSLRNHTPEARDSLTKRPSKRSLTATC